MWHLSCYSGDRSGIRKWPDCNCNTLKSVNTITCSQRLCFPVVQFLPNFLNVLYAWNIYQWTLNNQQSLVLLLIKLESHRWCNCQRNRLDLILERRSDQSKNYKIRIVVSSLDIVGEWCCWIYWCMNK